MKNRQIAARLALCAGCFIAGCFTAGAQSVVFSSGPVNGTITGYSINQGFAIANPFFVSKPTTIGAASFGAWLDTGDTLTSVDWAITSSPLGAILASGTALDPASTFVNSTKTGVSYTIYSEQFSLPDVFLGTGTYFFELQNAQTAESGPAFWDQNTSTLSTNTAAVQYENGSFARNLPGESFTLFTPAPEPATLALVCLGPVVLLALRRKK